MEKIEESCIRFSLKVWYNLTRNPWGPVLFIVGRLNIFWDRICLVIYVQKLYVFNVLSYNSLDVVSICGYVPFFIFDFVNWVCILLCFLMLAKGLMVFLIFAKNQLFVSLVLCIVFLAWISLISALIFIISPCLLVLGFVCSCISRRLRCIISFYF
jgi:hypothetical protein